MSQGPKPSPDGGGQAREPGQPDTFQQRLQTAENRIALSLASSAEGILFADNEGRIRYANAAAERLLGPIGGSLEGTSCADALKRITAANDAARARESGDTGRPMLAIETAPVFNDDQSFAGTVLGVTESCTVAGGGVVAGGKPRLLLRVSAAGSAQGQHDLRELVNDIANDFNNIMTAIIGNVSLARTEVSQDAGVYKT
ncbi:MAG TPA: PAS domain-containing protein, partial [Patescibacteria group bacterium]|nr:PAS domain-containing protein [Patescibacteria group bacterium]